MNRGREDEEEEEGATERREEKKTENCRLFQRQSVS